MGSPFRKTSLERLSSPEQLDQMLQVTSPATWMAFSSIAVLLITIIAWSIIGRIPQKTDGLGVLVPEGDSLEFPLQQIPALKTGVVSELYITEGDKVESGQLVARLQPVDFMDQQNAIEETELEISGLLEENEALTKIETTALAQMASQRDREKNGLQSIIDAKTINLQHLRTIATSKQDLARQSIITDEESIESASEVASAEAELNSLQHEMIQVDLNYEELEIATNKNRIERELEKTRLEARLRNLQNTLKEDSEVLSPFDGEILEIIASKGSEISRGGRLAFLEQPNKGRLRVIGYVPVFTGKNITPGMIVQISPSTIKKEEHGFLEGTVARVSDYPQDMKSILNLVQDQQIADQIIRQTEIPLQIELTLPAGDNDQQYSWSTGRAPPQKLSLGTISSFSVTTELKRPIELVIPFFKQSLGLN